MRTSLKRNIIVTTLCLGMCLMVAGIAFGNEQPSITIKPYGYFKLDGAYDQNLTSHGNFIMWVQPNSKTSDDEQFNMTANQSRLGLKANGTGYGEFEIYGNLEMDLYAGITGATVAENKAMLQLRHAYFSVQHHSFKLLAGQTWDLISPLNPSTLNYSVLWGCGNIGYRRPQISLFYTIKSNQTNVEIAGGFFRTIGSDLTPTVTLTLDDDKDGSDDGTDAGIPSFQGRMDVKHSWNGGGFVRAGVSGLWGQLKAESLLGESEEYESWGAIGHFMLSLSDGSGISGEAYTGSNMGGYFGGIVNGNTVDGLDSYGGWASAWVKASPQVKLVAGYGYDKPKDEDLSDGARSQNSAIFGNIQYNLVAPVTIGLEVTYWETQYKNSESTDNLRAQTSFVFSF